MAAAKNGVCSFLGRSGRLYQISMYSADTAAYINKWSATTGAGAGSSEYWRSPEAVVLVDFAMETGTTQTTMVMTEDGAVKNGAVLMFVPHLTTNAMRPKLSIPFNAGSLIGAQTI
jgi:hypothetical protein